MLISTRKGPFGSVGLHWVTSPLQGEGRVRVGPGLIGVLDNEPLTFILSPLEGERRQKTEVIRDY
jgi:hypothetical protein